MINGGARKEDAGKRKLPDIEEEKDHKGEEHEWVASKSQKTRTTDLDEGELCVAGGSAQIPAKRRTRQIRTTTTSPQSNKK